MCGIAGLIHQNPENYISQMLKSIEHRGYDNEGVFISQSFGNEQLKTCLGHRRLSIIDTTSAGHQPFFSANKRFVFTYNGELYNYLDIKKELEAKGYQFKTDSDTEVLINAFQEWNVDCLTKLNGMFAFAVWDELEKSLILVRDRAGIKPLYYAKVGEKFVFASEIKAILASKLIKAELDFEGLHQFLTFLWTVPPNTLFKNIYQLPPAHFLVWKNGEISVKEWWDLDFSREEKGKSENYWREQVLETLDKSVQLEMIADVPLGAFLSGGVDSSAIVALMTKHSKNISTYTTGISAEDLQFDIIPDDVEWSRKVAQILPIDYHETLLTPDLTELLPKLVYHMDAPVIDMAIPSFLISEQSRQTQKVMLSGMGGDEVFAGYPRQMAMKIAGMTDFIPSAVRKPLMKTIDSWLVGGKKGKFTAPLRNAKKFARSAGEDFEQRYLGFGTYFSDEMKNRLYSSNLRDNQKNFDAFRFHKKYFENCKAASPLNRLLYVDFKTFMPALNLDTTDKTSMAANLEVRVPFLNHEIVSLSERIPTDLKIKGIKRKYILKKAAESLLPKEVIWRKKAGFGAPIRSWLRTSLKPMIDDLLSEETIKRRGLFDSNEVQKIIELNQKGKEDFNLQVFQLLNLEIWMQQFLD
ncbi:MAG TPA: asparagine synthase (glutamine-hydrolyzing) [Pyrinomonadaceae bacterium]|nr:asparagine synthase (glutamine-hydrolyzing) [Pyrinomonadaceae bacterium]